MMASDACHQWYAPGAVLCINYSDASNAWTQDTQQACMCGILDGAWHLPAVLLSADIICELCEHHSDGCSICVRKHLYAPRCPTYPWQSSGNDLSPPPPPNNTQCLISEMAACRPPMQLLTAAPADSRHLTAAYQCMIVALSPHCGPQRTYSHHLLAATHVTALR